ncbi:hypothetical protein F4Y59_03835 [Candidatus Poribacteria bacterium]|nr:hypothetical protein [Candidatus Poribacteria bacterium]MXY27280.1 hypothetical protein [Candidatus Poribacteria bacterium]MYK20224.1 hypothetical protein [Candidatus Poribacteria bacterium]
MAKQFYLKLNQDSDALFELIEQFRVLHIEHAGEMCYVVLYGYGEIDTSLVKAIENDRLVLKGHSI